VKFVVVHFDMKLLQNLLGDVIESGALSAQELISILQWIYELLNYQCLVMAVS
jgi:hypothetical protein